MAQITEDYVSFETAKLLKEKRFDEQLEMLIREDGTRYHADTNSVSKKRHIMLRNSEINTYSTDLSCPTLQMAMKWLREEHNIFLSIQQHMDMSYVWYIYKNGISKGCDRESHNNSYEQACEAAIKYCLENLI